MDELLSRAFVSDIEVRASAEGRTIHGIVVPFDVSARVSDGGKPYEEMFTKGAFARTIQHRGNRVKLLSQHQSRQNPLGRATLLREDATGLYGEFQVSATRAGDEALELVRDGALDSFSVGFSPIHHVKRGETVVRTEVGLREASLVTFPAYDGALVGGVRWDSLSDEERADLLLAIGEHFNLQPTTSRNDGDSEADGTATALATADSDSATPLRSATQNRLAFARALRERGVA